jgi:hypothetical protein
MCSGITCLRSSKEAAATPLLLVLAVGSLAGSCGGMYEVEVARGAAELFSVPVPTQTAATRKFLYGYDPYFDRLAGAMLTSDCFKLKLSGLAGDVRITYLNSSEELKEALSAAGHFSVNLAGFDGTAQGRFSSNVEKYTEDLFFLLSSERTFDLDLDYEASKPYLTKKAQKIVDDVEAGTLSLEDGALQWLADGGPGYLKSERRGASLVVLLRLHSERVKTNVDLAASLKASLGKKQWTIAELNAAIGKAVSEQLNKMDLSVMVRARGFTLPPNDKDTERLLWGLLTPKPDSKTPFSDIIDSALAQEQRMQATVTAARCVVENKLNGTMKECKDGDKVVTEDTTAVLRLTADKYSGRSECVTGDKVKKMFDRLYAIWAEAVKYAESYRMLTLDGARAEFEISDALGTPTRHGFLNSEDVKPPVSKAGIERRFDGIPNHERFYLRDLMSGRSDGALGKALVQYKACLQSVGGGIYKPKCTPPNGAEKEAEYIALRKVLKEYLANDRVPMIFYRANKTAVVGKDLPTFIKECTAEGRELPPAERIQYLSLAQATFPRPLQVWISNVGQKCPPNTNAVALLTLADQPPHSRMDVTFDCFSTADPPPAAKSSADAVCIAKDGVLGDFDTQGIFGLSSIWRR